MEKTVEPSRDLVDVTRTPLDALRSDPASAHAARRLVDELLDVTSSAQEQNADQYKV